MAIPCSLDSSLWWALNNSINKENMHGWCWLMSGWFITVIWFQVDCTIVRYSISVFPSLQCPFAFYFLGFWSRLFGYQQPTKLFLLCFVKMKKNQNLLFYVSDFLISCFFKFWCLWQSNRIGFWCPWTRWIMCSKN